MKGTAPLIGLVMLAFLSCKKELPPAEDPVKITTENKDIKDLDIPENFDYASTKSITLDFSEQSTGHVLYEIYTVYDQYNRAIIAKGQPVKGHFIQKIIVPTFCEKLQIVRNENGLKESFFLSVINKNRLTHSFSTKVSRQNCTETFYAVNTAKELYTINNEEPDYATSTLPDLGTEGIITCAVDPVKKRMYYNSGNELYYYDIDLQTNHPVSDNILFSGEYKRMEFNESNGFLYIAKKDEMYVIDPEDNSIKASIQLNGLDNPNQEGDIAINSKGEIYMCTFSGLYQLDPISNLSTTSVVNVTKISAKSFKYKLTGAVFDKDDRLYVTTHDSNSKLIEIDPQSGDYTILKTLPFSVNDLGIYKCSSHNNVNLSDLDKDGVIDEMDGYPANKDLAFDIFTPSEITWGTLAYEDLWPYEGDYDFNDLVINYRFIQIANAQNQIAQLKCLFQVKAVVNSYKNGFGIELPISPGLVKQVKGSAITDNLVTLNSKGLEQGQSNTVIIAFDNAFKQVKQWGACVNHTSNPIIEINLEFNEPIDASLLGEAPYNPFIFVDGDRSKEIHLTTGSPTALANPAYLGSKDDNSEPGKGRYYKTSKNLPWAIHIPYEFVYPQEKVKINKGYYKFNIWAESNGTQYSDWYMEGTDLRNEEVLCQ